MNRRSLGITVLFATAVGAIWLVQAGSLEPPGPPGQTMTELDHVRGTPIYQSDFGPTGYLIDSPGSYYLAEDIAVTGDGIVINGVNANDITIDLMGHSLSNGTGRGIYADHGTKNLAVINGTVSGWSSEGIHLGNATECLVQNVRATNNQGTGIIVGVHSRVLDSHASYNQSIGIEAGRDSLLLRSIASDNNESGILTGGKCTIAFCKAIANGDRSGPTDDDGIRAGSSSVIQHCSAVDNWGDGIEVHSDCVIRNNECDHQDDSGGAAIHITGGSNRIEANHMVRNGYAIKVDSDGGNVIIRNTAAKEGNYDIPPGNFVGTIVTNEAAMNAATNDLVNIRH